jgi:alpha-glucosidase
LLLLLPITTPARAADATSIASPDGRLVVTMSLQQGAPVWASTFDGQTILQAGRLGVEVDKQSIGIVESLSAETASHREAVKTVWGKFAEYDDHYNELAWTLRETAGGRRTLVIRVRVYDSGVGLRYEFPDDGGWGETINLTGGSTEFRFTKDGTGWCYNRERDPVGPQPLSAFHGGQGADLPFTIQCGPETFVGIMEAAIFQQAPFRLKPASASATTFAETFDTSVLPAGGVTGWRVLLVGRQAGDLLTSPVLYCLNPPCAIDDTSWIKPGLAFWDWRAWGAATEDGFRYDLDMASWRRFIDFASKNNIRYLVLDANWYGPEFEPSSDPRVSRDHLVIQPDMAKPHIVRQPAPGPSRTSFASRLRRIGKIRSTCPR